MRYDSPCCPLLVVFRTITVSNWNVEHQRQGQGTRTVVQIHTALKKNSCLRALNAEAVWLPLRAMEPLGRTRFVFYFFLPPFLSYLIYFESRVPCGVGVEQWLSHLPVTAGP